MRAEPLADFVSPFGHGPLRALDTAPGSGSRLGLLEPRAPTPLLRPLSQPAPSSAPRMPKSGFCRPAPQAAGGAWGAPVGSWEEGTFPGLPPPSSRRRCGRFFSSPVPSYRRFSAEWRPTLGVNRAAPGGGCWDGMGRGPPGKQTGKS